MSDHGNELSRRSVLKHSALATGSVILGGVAASGTAAAGIGDGRVGHYNLNNLHYNVNKGEKVQNHVHDASPEKNHGKWKSSADNGPITDGKVGRGFYFESEGDEIEIEDGITIPEGSDVTYATWLNVDEWLDNNPGGWRSGSDSRGGFFNIFQSDSGRPYIRWNGTDILKPGSGASVPTGTWVHVAYVVRSEDNAEFYIDGSKEHGANHIQRTGKFDINHIGWQFRKQERIKGAYDEIRFYDRALSDTEIQELASMGDD